MRRLVFIFLLSSCKKAEVSCNYKYVVNVPISTSLSCLEKTCLYKTIGKERKHFCKEISGNFNTTFHAKNCIDLENIKYESIDFYNFEKVNFTKREECSYI